MNIIEKLAEGYCTWLDRWSPARFSFLLQAVLLFGLPMLFCWYAFQRGSRSVFVQTLAFVLGLLLAASVPVEGLIPLQPLAKAWVATLCLALLAFLPAILPCVLTPQLGKQRKLQIAFYVVLAALFLVNLLLL